MNKSASILVVGHTGLVGSALLRRLTNEGFENIITASLPEIDLRNQQAVNDFFTMHRPEYLFLAAAKVGGIMANKTYPASFVYDNLMIQANVINAAYRAGVIKLLFFGSSCIYPRNCPQPIKEEYLLSGKLEETNQPYAIAKIAGISLCQSYNAQYGTHFICCMPTNLYGPCDNFDPEHSHVLPGLITKFLHARDYQLPAVTLWGTGTPRREFLYVDDLADAALFLMQQYNGNEIINVGTGHEVTIQQLAELIADEVGYKGEIRFDSTFPDGTPQKLLDVSRLNGLGWRATTSLHGGIKKTVDWYLNHNPMHMHAPYTLRSKE